MKKLLLSFFALFLSLGLSASHFVGGEITWKCTPTGEYVFYMNIFRDCSGIPSSFVNETITISGSPLPSNGVTSIVMKPDSGVFVATNNGDLSAHCSSSYGSQLSCQAGDFGVLQLLPYLSDPIRLTGTPPAAGWNFSIALQCCLSNRLINVFPRVPSGSAVLRSTMYPYQNSRVDTCFYNSPKFVEVPSSHFCRGDLVSYSNRAISSGGDSLDYSSVALISGSAVNSTALSYRPGYSPASPTPDTSFDINNVPYTLNSRNGGIEFLVNNGSGSLYYSTSTRVESYRNGVKVTSVERVLPLVISDCDTMPSGNQNTAPFVSPPFISGGVRTFSTTVVAGTNLINSIAISDTNNTGVGTGSQEITISPISSSFSTDLITSTACFDPKDTSCAIFAFPPALDTNQVPARLVYKSSSGSALLFFSWQTDCNHLSPSGNAKTHYFTFKVSDDHCPIPKVIYKTISITVTPSANCSLLTGMEDLNSLNEEIKLYPNPTSGVFSIDLGQIQEQVELKVLNVKGQLIQQEVFLNRDRISAEIQAKGGIYFLQVINSKGERANLKVIKH